MTGSLDDVSAWRLRTTGGVPYKLVSTEGEFQEIKASTSFKILIRGSDLIAFCTEIFPPPLTFGSISLPQYVNFGGMNLICQSVSFKGFVDGIPIDPIGFDPGAPAGTYFPTLELTLKLATPPIGTPNPADPFTFLEVSADSTGEYLFSPTAKAKSQEVDSNGKPVAGSTPTTIRTPLLPHTILVPQTTWSVKWNKIPLDTFRDGLRPRLQSALGKVNSLPFSLLYASYNETLLFVGYSYRYSYTWRQGYVNKPFIDLDMKFLEKSIQYKGKIRGHQDVWRPGVGWDRLLIDGQPTYDSIDFAQIFTQ